MKLLVAVIQNRDANTVIRKLNQAHHILTRLDTMGGFLHEGNTTLLIGVPDEQIEAVLDLLREFCHRRQRARAVPIAGIEHGLSRHGYIEVEVGGATVFIIPVEHFEQI